MAMDDAQQSEANPAIIQFKKITVPENHIFAASFNKKFLIIQPEYPNSVTIISLRNKKGSKK